MSLLVYKSLAALFIFLTTLAAVAYPVWTRARLKQHFFLELGDAFASGVFLGAALFHMLPDASEEFHQIYPKMDYPLAEFFCVAGFVLLLFLERLSLNSVRMNNNLTIPYVAALTLIIHSLIEGAALGVNTELATVSVLFLAIFVHKGSESFALSILLCRGNHLPLRHLFWIIGIFSLMTPLGIALGSIITPFLQFKQGQIINASFNAFAAGTFLYMSTLHHINHHQRLQDGNTLWEFVSWLVGVSMMGLLVFWI